MECLVTLPQLLSAGDELSEDILYERVGRITDFPYHSEVRVPFNYPVWDICAWIKQSAMGDHEITIEGGTLRFYFRDEELSTLFALAFS